MKTNLFLITLLLALNTSLFSQEIPPAPANKAVVYFVRATSYGFAINFSYFDSTKLIGIFAGKGYFRYECEPGTHLFWARSENKDFIEAHLEAGKIYFIDVIVQMGWVKAQVSIDPIDGKNPKKMKGILKVLAKKTPETFTEDELTSRASEFNDVVARGMAKHKEDLEKGNSIKQLEASMFYTK